MSTAPGTAKKLMTVDEFWEFVHRRENEDRSFELIRGEVVEASRPRSPHGIIAARICSLLDRYAERVGRGYVLTESGVVLNEKEATVVDPDAAYFTDVDRFEDVHPKWNDVPPVLAVEVWSPADRPGRTNAKIQEYLKNGVKIVWYVDYEERRVTVFRPKQEMEVVDEGGELTGGDDVPGLSIKVADIFKLAGDRQPPAAAPPAPQPPTA